MDTPSDASAFGKRYWCVQLENGDGVHFHYDDLSRTPARWSARASKEGQTVVMFTAGPGRRGHAYAASMVHCRRVAVEFWEKKGSKGGAKGRK
jgi:hypothetical protein